MSVLANENHERYARLRAILVPPRAAAKSIGYAPTSGIATKLEKNPKVAARIAELVADEEAVLRQKRAQIEAGLSAIAYGDGTEFPGTRVIIEWPHRLNALAQLRDMHGLKAVMRSEQAVALSNGRDGRPFRSDGSFRLEFVSLPLSADHAADAINVGAEPEIT